MTKNKPTNFQHRVVLFVCSGCEGCDQATAFMQGWANGRQDVALDIVNIADRPEQFVRYGIMHSPARVIDGELLAQKVSVNSLTKLMSSRLHGPEAGPQTVS
jgi:hypothetical protein